MGVFRPNPDFDEEIKEDEDYKKVVLGLGQVLAAEIKAVAPRGETADYVDSIESDEDGSVGTTDPFGHLVEWGSVNNPAYAPIRRGVSAAGLRLEEEDK
jgi:hypothetical protein